MIVCPQCGARNFAAEDPGPCDHNGDCECFFVPGKGWVAPTPKSCADEFYRIQAELTKAADRHERICAEQKRIKILSMMRAK